MLNEDQKFTWETLVLKNCMLYTPPIKDTEKAWYFEMFIGLKNFMEYILITNNGLMNLGKEKTVYGFTLRPDTPGVIKTAMLMECGYTMKQALETRFC